MMKQSKLSVSLVSKQKALDKRFRARKADRKFALQMLSEAMGHSPQTRYMQAQESNGDGIVNKVEAGGPAAVETG